MKTQSTPKFEYQLNGYNVAIPAVLFHFDNPRLVASALSGLDTSKGVCVKLCQAYEMASDDYRGSVNKTYRQIGRALAIKDHELGGHQVDIYLEQYFWFKYGIELERRGPAMIKLRQAWAKHIAKHLMAAEG